MGLPQETGEPNHAAKEGASDPSACFAASLRDSRLPKSQGELPRRGGR